MKTSKLRTIIPIAVLFIVGIGFVTKFGIGTTSAIGWEDVSLLCPLGALGTMLAAKLMIPRAAISFLIALALIIVFGRAFCAWICPIPPISKLRKVFGTKDAGAKKRAMTSSVASSSGKTAGASAEEANVVRVSLSAEVPATTDDVVQATESPDDTGVIVAEEPAAYTAESKTRELTAEQRKLLSSCRGCGGLTSRHWVLGGALLSTLIFGFPVFCLICPIGLSFALILLVVRLFGMGDVTWTAILVPTLLLIEVVFFRRWCHTFCPLGALMSLVAKANRTFRPTVDKSKCIETTSGKRCHRCTQVCPEGINLHTPELGSKMNECTKCHACVEACPTGALSMPFLAKTSAHDTTHVDGSGKPQQTAGFDAEATK